jgi:hypothetical protein
MRVRTSRWMVGVLCAAGMLALASCNSSTTSIKTLLDDPGRFNGTTVRIVGDVSSAMGVLGYGAYKVNDGTGSILVVTKEGGAPRDGAKVGVEGTFHSAFTLGAETAAVVEEIKRYTP